MSYTKGNAWFQLIFLWRHPGSILLTWSSWLDSQFSVFFVPVNNVYLPIAQQHSLRYGESDEQYECPVILLIVAYYNVMKKNITTNFFCFFYSPMNSKSQNEPFQLQKDMVIVMYSKYCNCSGNYILCQMLKMTMVLIWFIHNKTAITVMKS